MGRGQEAQLVFDATSDLQGGGVSWRAGPRVEVCREVERGKCSIEGE